MIGHYIATLSSFGIRLHQGGLCEGDNTQQLVFSSAIYTTSC